MNFLEHLNSLYQFYNLQSPQNKNFDSLSNKKIIIFSPHPDDEVLMGSLALRLKNENNCQVIVIAMTLGSNKQRQAERKIELEKSCQILNFNFEIKNESAIEILNKQQPNLVILPHQFDQHQTHQAVYQEVWEALRIYSKNKKIFYALSEFWLPNLHPNLMIEISKEDVHSLYQALLAHKGEIQRNPYHLRLTSFYMDSVRRGQELVGSHQSQAIHFLFGQNYELGYFENEISYRAPSQMISKETSLSSICN